MKLVMVEADGKVCPGRIAGDRVVELSTRNGFASLSGLPVSNSLLSKIQDIARSASD
jgi:hypothetical protein